MRPSFVKPLLQAKKRELTYLKGLFMKMESMGRYGEVKLKKGKSQIGSQKAFGSADAASELSGAEYHVL